MKKENEDLKQLDDKKELTAIDEDHEHEEESVDILEELNEMMEELPEEHRKVVLKITSMMMSHQMYGIQAPESTIAKKIAPEHISMYLQGMAETTKNAYAERKSNKWFILVTTILAMVFFIAIIILLKDKSDIMEKVLYTISGVLAGAFGGYGIGKYKRDS